jgi:hypothetical protein
MTRKETNVQKDLNPVPLKMSTTVTERILLIKKLRATMLRVDEQLTKLALNSIPLSHPYTGMNFKI